MAWKDFTFYGHEIRERRGARTFDHADVVGSVADRERNALAMPFNEVDDERLLERRDAATNDRLTTRCYIEQQHLHLATQRVHLQFTRRANTPINK